MYEYDKEVSPTILAVSNAEMRSRALEIVDTSILKECSNEFNYDDIIHIEKDNTGNIVLVKADTLKMNKLACVVALDSQKELTKLGKIGIVIPLGYIFKNNLLAGLGPDITVKMQPIGSIETNYISVFESVGLNQTRHKIYVEFKTTIRVILPFSINDLEVKNDIPIAETIIVGKVPSTSIDLDLKDAGYKANLGVAHK